MSRSFPRSFFVLLLLLTLPRSVNAQWKQVASNLFISPGVGAIAYCQGDVWLVADKMYFSSDLGATWSLRSIPPSVTTGLQFFDPMTGVAASNNGTYLTRDGGMTWTLIKTGGAFACTFGATSSIIVTASAIPEGVSVSTDQGLTWTTRIVVDYPLALRTMRNGTLLMFGGGTITGGALYQSTDNGQTWRSRGGTIDFDSYSFSIDSCDDNRIYLANEDALQTTDNLSQIFLTVNGGASWKAQDVMQLPGYSGSIELGPSTVYAQTVSDGIHRSTDRGLTWQPNGGPSFGVDSHYLAVISDNLVVSADDVGNVWRTTNAGGDSVLFQLLHVTPQSVSLSDTIQACDNESFTIATLAFCNSINVSSFQIVGPDSLDYAITSGVRNDSVTIVFSPVSGGNRKAALEFTLTDGRKIDVPLNAFGSLPTISILTQNAFNDTIGGSVTVPIIANEKTVAGDLAFSIDFDSTNLQYIGTYPSGNATDATIATSPHVAHVLLKNLSSKASGEVLGYAVFHVFPHRDSCTSVTIDSISISRSNHICELASPLRAQVCSNVGCGTSTLSDFLRYRQLPTLSTYPNPSNGEVSISTDRSLGQCSLVITDDRGEPRMAFERELNQGVAIPFDLSILPSGTYTVRATNALLSVTARLSLTK